jgi:hypothetical protein
VTKPNLSREYLLSDELKREMESYIERGDAALRAKAEQEARRRRRLQRLSFGLLGR